MVPNAQPSADKQTIVDHLTHLTRRWHELAEPCLLEVVFLTAEDKARVHHVAHYNPDNLSLDIAADDIIGMNGHGVNAYATVNPVSRDNRPPAGKRANASQIVASFFHFADADDAQAAENIRNFAGPKCNFHVLTGTQPCLRPHVYWELEDPTYNLAAWSEIQKAVAATLGTDPAVTDPPRIMRIAGAVNWPKPKKQAKGYVPELVGLKFYSEDDRPLVTSEQMYRAFAGRAQPASAAPTGDFEIDTGAQRLDRERARIQALSGQEWHHSVVRLVASYVARGLSNDEIHGLTDPLTLPGYTVEETRREVQTAIDGARRKGWTPEQDFTPNFDHAPAPSASQPHPPAETWRVQSAADFTADFVAPEYLIDGVIQRGRLYTLTAPTGAGKTAAMLYASTAIAMGEQFCGRETECGDVLFLAGENPDDVRARFIATMDFYGIDPAKCRVHFIAGTFSIRADMARLREAAESLPNLLLVVVDTFAAYFDGDDENSNAQALDFARVVRGLTSLRSKPAAIMPAHPVKNATRQNLTPKGGSSLLNEVDGNLTLWNADGLVSLHWQGKHRGPDFEPMRIELQRVECEKIRDHKGRVMPTILAKPVLELRATQIARETLKLEDQLLLNISDDEGLSIRERCRAMGMVRDDGEPETSRMSRLLERLRADKMIKKVRRKWVLTDAGKKEVEAIIEGQTQPLETSE